MRVVLVVFLMLSSILGYSQSSSDCDCDIVITSNQNLPNNIANKTVCLQGDFIYSNNINLKNKTELCISENVIVTGAISGNWSQEKTIKNYGEFSPSNPNVSSIPNSEFYNNGIVNANINFNQGDNKVFYNYGELNGNILSFRSGSIHNFSGAVISTTNSTTFGSSIQFLNEGLINVGQNLTFENNLTLGGTYQVNGNTTFNTSYTTLDNANFNITGDLFLWSGNTITTANNNTCSNLVFDDMNQWHGSINATNGALSLSTFYNSQNISGNVSTTPCGSNGGPNLSETVWLGNNKHFNQIQNWSNGLPASDKNVIIPSTTKNPLLSSGDFSVGNLTIDAGAELEIENETILTISGDLNVEGALNAEFGKLIFEGSESDFTINANGDVDIQSIEVSSASNLTLQGTRQINVYYLLDITDGAMLTTNDLLTLKCKFIGNNPTVESYQVGQVAETTGSISGNIMVEQCYTGRRAFRMLASSVNTTESIKANWQENATSYNHNPKPGYGTHITGVGNNNDGYNGFDWQPSGNPSMFTFDNLSQSWSTQSNTFESLQVGQPFRLMIRGDRSIDLTSNSAAPNRTILRAFGEIHQGDKIVTDLSSVSEEYNVVANPYQSVVDLVEVYQDSNNILPYFIIWDPTLGTRGAFAYINLITLEKSNNNSEISRFLLPQQAGFFVTANDGEAEIIFKESHKNPSKIVPVVLSENTYPTIHAQVFAETLFENDEKSSDGLHISFKPNGSNDVNELDALKMSNLDENLARFQNGKLISIEERSLPNTTENLGLFVDTFTTDNYVFKFNVENFEGFQVYLKDNYTQENTLLSEGENVITMEVDQSINASVAYNRFSLEISPVSLDVNDFKESDLKIFPNPITGNELQIQTSLLLDETDVEIYNSFGARLKSFNVDFNTSGNVSLKNLDLASGVYILKLKTKSGKVFTKKLIKK